ncbi:heme-binding protein 2-like [Asterias amurensis]|uniref:heme-binding protein 2-like n=1 Tax=Asterias amurensis TaxID=7602 RepID=UPI003AB80595
MLVPSILFRSLSQRGPSVFYKKLIHTSHRTMFAAIKTLFTELETPKYEVEKDSTDDKKKEYEVRRYGETTTWVTISNSSIDEPSEVNKPTKESRGMFFKLFNYISGENDKKQKIDMTVPVLKKITPGAGPFCETTTDMSFYVTKEFQGSPPTPSAEDVHVTHLPAQRVVVRTFDGYTSEAKDLEQARILAELTKDKFELEQSYFFTAGYNSPWRVTGRRNEVWFVIKDDQKPDEANVKPTSSEAYVETATVKETKESSADPSEITSA